MTEAVKAMCDWAIEKEKVANLIAETDLNGFGSQRILFKDVDLKKNPVEKVSFGKYKHKTAL